MDYTLEKFYRRVAYFELLEEFEIKLKSIPLEIERLQIEYCKSCLIMLDSFDMEDKKKETEEKIEYLKEDELDYKDMIHRLKEKYGALYDDGCECENHNEDKRAMKKNLFRKKK